MLSFCYEVVTLPLSSTTLLESNHTTVIIEDGNTLVGQAHHVGYYVASSSKDLLNAMRRVDTSMHEITKYGFEVQKKQGHAKSSGSLFEWIDSMTRQPDNPDNVSG
ncbi:hypothetical protein J1N35_033275 [Gossypium stocksii]|uniref:Uncharacterized protein n=1 Tax=Gossypium stocksii TaxID=47602 RepID=A0A9D3ZPF9_9ROSI|nr:hypothetical protein J1N35_033275 [Gossypium stocksii]